MGKTRNSQYDHGGYFYTREIVWLVSGEKAAKFLQGQLTNDILALSAGDGNYNLLLTVKGKIVADLFVYRVAKTEFYLSLKKEFEGKVVDHLQKLAPLSRVVVIPAKPSLSVVHVIIPTLPPTPSHSFDFAQDRRGRGNQEIFPLPWWERVRERGVTVFKTMRLGYPGYDLLVPVSEVDALHEKLKSAHVNPLSDEHQEIIRVEQGICKVGVDATEDNLPQEARLIHAISFTKGCYLGQEIVARLQYRGHVNKILAGLVFDGDKIPATHYPELSSCIFSTKLGRPLGLGYVASSVNQPGQKIKVASYMADIIDLPLCHPVPA